MCSRFTEAGLVTVGQLAPESVVFQMAPSDPTATPFWASKKCIWFMPAGAVASVHWAPRFTVRATLSPLMPPIRSHP